MTKTLVLAHRGASAYRAENTIPAFELAIQQQADGFEIDVHLTKDGKAVVTHDENTQRVTGIAKEVSDSNFSELNELNFASFREQEPFTRLPRLEEVLELIKINNLYLNIELKNSIKRYRGMEEKVLALVKQYHVESQVFYSSFNHQSMKYLKSIAPAVKTGLLFVTPHPFTWEKARLYKANALHPRFSTLRIPGFTAITNAYRMEINTWTVNTTAEIELALKERCNSLITNRPDDAIHIRESFLQ